jgi:hypothetical protein
MTTTEKLAMFKEKRNFIKNISKAFEVGPKGSSVQSVDYEVYRKDTPDIIYFVEYVIVTFFGGGYSVKCVNGNSNTANFRAVGSILDGGYYDEVFEYDKLKSIGYEKVIFEETKRPLDEYLEEPMKHISDVARCFDHCVNGKDVVKVIRMIPSCFGAFTVEFNDDGESFRIINYFEEDGVMQSEEYDFDFYMEETV